jgi:exosome complex exonuclease RRP6
MTQQVLSDIARIMPTDMKALWSLLESNARRLKARLGELFEVIQAARARGANGPTMLEFFRQSSTGAVQTGEKQAVATAVEDSEPLSIEELKSNRSQLWGDVALNSTLDGTSKARPISDQEMIPLYTFDFGAIKEELPQATEPPPKPAPKQDAAAVPVAEDEGFTLKTGRKRKASDADIQSASDAESASDVDMDGFPSADQAAESPDAEVQGEEGEAEEDTEATEATKKATKQAKKAIRKEYNRVLREVKALIKKGDTQAAEKLKEEGRKVLKAGMKSIRKSGGATAPSAAAAGGSPESSEPPQQASEEQEQERDEQQDEEDEEQPFDYGAASSVLHASKNNGGANNNASGGGRGGKRGKKRGGGRAAAFDPYAKKSGDAPAGARKMNYEKAGRTATFKK